MNRINIICINFANNFFLFSYKESRDLGKLLGEFFFERASRYLLNFIRTGLFRFLEIYQFYSKALKNHVILCFSNALLIFNELFSKYVPWEK